MIRPRLLDLFCGAGGCSVGYQRAGFEVVGVDHKPMPRYPFEFQQCDALEFLAEHGHEFDAIHASPPCQAYTLMRHLGKNSGLGAPDLLKPTRDALERVGRPWVIENVVGAPMKPPLLMLCGSMFGLRVRRHRVFESSVMLLGQYCNHSGGAPVPVWGDGRPSRQEARKARPIAVYGDHPQQPGNKTYRVNRARTLAEGQAAMGIDWMPWKELTQAIPPAYTEWIGRQLIGPVNQAVNPHEAAIGEAS